MLEAALATAVAASSQPRPREGGCSTRLLEPSKARRPERHALPLQAACRGAVPWTLRRPAGGPLPRIHQPLLPRCEACRGVIAPRRAPGGAQLLDLGISTRILGQTPILPALQSIRGFWVKPLSCPPSKVSEPLLLPLRPTPPAASLRQRCNFGVFTGGRGPRRGLLLPGSGRKHKGGVAGVARNERGRLSHDLLCAQRVIGT
jgi:hypothetical protein